jgi:hypothetical protein
MNVHAIDTDSSTALHAIRVAVRAPGAGGPDPDGNLADSIPAENQRITGVWNGSTAIRPVYPYTLFNKSPLQLRRIGALGGKAHGRNQRARRARLTTLPEAVPPCTATQETTAKAIAVLDAQFPWLWRAEKRPSRSRQPRRRCL